MSPTARNIPPSAASPRRGPLEVVGARRVLTLRWSLSRPAALAAGLVKGDGDIPLLEVALPWDVPTVTTIAAAVIDGERRREMALEPVAPGHWIVDEANGLRHLDLPGLVRVSMRWTDGAVQVLYARTEVLARLGLPGGRYDFEGATLGAE